MPPKMPKAPRDFEAAHKPVWDAFQQLTTACHEAGPLDEKSRRMVKLGLSIGAGLEGGTHSAVRHALEGGCTPEEIEHAAVLAISTLGWPASIRAWTWVRDALGR